MWLLVVFCFVLFFCMMWLIKFSAFILFKMYFWSAMNLFFPEASHHRASEHKSKQRRIIQSLMSPYHLNPWVLVKVLSLTKHSGGYEFEGSLEPLKKRRKEEQQRSKCLELYIQSSVSRTPFFDLEASSCNSQIHGNLMLKTNPQDGALTMLDKQI